MPQSAITQTITRNVRVVPLYPGEAKRIGVNLPAGATYNAGQVLGQITSSANAVHTVTVTGTPTGGTFTLTGTHPLSGATFTTGTIAYNAAASAVATAVSTALAGVGPTITVTGGGGALPGTPVTLTYSGAAASRPVQVLALGTNALTGGTAPTVTVASTTAGRSAGTFTAYANGASDGSEVARGILEYTVTVRSNGLIYVGQTIYGNEEGLPSTPMYITGTFRTTELTGLDAAGVTDLGRLVSGTVADGILALSGA